MKHIARKLAAFSCSVCVMSGGLSPAQERLPFVLPVQVPAPGPSRSEEVPPLPPATDSYDRSMPSKSMNARGSMNNRNRDEWQLPEYASSARSESNSTGTTVGPSDLKFEESLKSLRGELDSLRTMRRDQSGTDESVDVGNALATVRQRRMLLDLLQRLATAGPRKTERRQAEKATDDGEEQDGMLKLPNLVGGDTVDNFSLGRSLFRAGEFVQAEQAFRAVSYDGTNEWQMKYLIATCLRKQNKTDDAMAMYQQVVLQSNDSTLSPPAGSCRTSAGV